MKQLFFFLLLSSSLINAVPKPNGWNEVEHDTVFQAPTTVSSLAFSGNGEQLAAAGNLDETVTIWRLGPKQPSGRCLEGVRSVSFNNDGKGLLWDVERQESVGSMIHSQPQVIDFVSEDSCHMINSVAFGSAHAVTGGEDGVARLWDSRQRDAVLKLCHQSGPINGVAISGNERVVTAGGDGTARSWDLRRTQQAAHLLRHAREVHAVTFNEEHGMASAGCDAHVKLVKKLKPRVKRAVSFREH